MRTVHCSIRYSKSRLLHNNIREKPRPVVHQVHHSYVSRNSCLQMVQRACKESPISCLKELIAQLLHCRSLASSHKAQVSTQSPIITGPLKSCKPINVIIRNISNERATLVQQWHVAGPGMTTTCFLKSLARQADFAQRHTATLRGMPLPCMHACM